MSARLRHRRRRRKGRLDGRGRITITHELGERPAIADRRERVGEGEGDTVAGRIGGAVLVTLVDRATGYLVGGKAPSKRAVGVSLLNRAGPCPHTVGPSPWTGGVTSSPPGPPSKNHWAPPVHFYEARCALQRGSGENTNGLLRERFPKRTPLDGVSPTRTQQVHDQLNQRPRKRLGWKTPEEAHTHPTLHFLRKTQGDNRNAGVSTTHQSIQSGSSRLFPAFEDTARMF